MKLLNQRIAPNTKRSFIESLRNFWRDDRGDTPTQVFIGAVVAIVLIVPTMTFFVNFLAQTSVTAVDGERQKDLRSWAIDEFESKPWNEVLSIFESNEIKKGDVSAKFNFNIKYAVDELDNSGGYVVKLVAPRANVNQSACSDPRDNKKNLCLYYQYTKTPTLSEGLVPSWSGMNYGQADIQPASGTNSPSLAITNDRVVNIGSFDGCSALTPDRIRLSFKWTGTNTIRPGSVQHLVIGNKLFETIPLASADSSNSIWYAVTINKPQPSTCYGAEQVRIMIDNGARGTISDVYVAQLLSLNDEQHDGSGDDADENLPHIVSDPAWATDGVKWYLTFQNPLTGADIQSYQIRGTGGQAGCNNNTQTITKGNANNGVDSVLLVGTYNDVATMKAAVCDRYYIISLGANGYNSAEISFLTAGINKVVNVDDTGSQVAPSSPTNGRFTTDNVNWYLRFDQSNIGTIDHFKVVGAGTNPQCNTNQQSVNPTDGVNALSLGTFSSEENLRSGTCTTFKVTAVGTNGKSSSPVTFTTSSMTVGTN